MTDLPPGWTSVRLGEVSLPVEKVEPKELGRPNFRYVDIGSVDGNNQLIADVQSLAVEDAPSRARQLIRSGDTVFSTVRPYLKKIGYVSGELDGEIASTGFCVLRPGPCLDSRYLFHLSYSDDFLSQVLPKQRGVSYPAVRPTDLFEVDIPLPPLEEQRRIMTTLEDHLLHLDAGFRGVAKSRVRLRAWTSALLYQVLQGHYHETDQKGVVLPPGWEWLTIGDLAVVGTGMTPLRSRQDYYAEGTVPWVTSTLVNQPFIGEAKQYVTEKALLETSLKIWPKGALVVAMYGEGQTRGRSSELLVDAAMNQACAAIVLKPQYENRRPWVKLVLEANYQRMRRLASGGVQPNLNLNLVRGIRIPLPPVEEQDRILSDVSESRARQARLDQTLVAAVTRGTALRRALLKEAFTGRLVSQDADDEPASELLARIRAERAAQPKAGRGRRTKTVEAPVAGRTEWPDAGRMPVSYEQEELL